MVKLGKNKTTTLFVDRSSEKNYSRLGLGIDRLWIIGALVGFAFLVSLNSLPPNDFWWHLKAGEFIFSTGTVPRTNMFAWSISPDTPYIYGAWLAEYLFYLLFRLGGISLITFMRNLLAVVAFGLVGYEAYRRSGSWRIAGVVTELACLMTANNLIVRTQNWAWIPFIVFLILFSAYADGKLRGGWLLLCPLVMAFWVNVHGSFILGIVLAAIYFSGEAIRSFLKLEGHRTWREVAWMGAVGILTIGALLANPLHVGVFGYVQKMMTDRSSQKLIVEWQSPDPANLASLVFFLSILCLIAAWAYNKKRRPTPTEMLTVAAFLMLAWSGVRYVVWYGMAVMPLLAASLSDFLQGKSWANPPPRNRINLILAVLLILPLIPFQPWLIEKMPLPEKVWEQVWKETPVGPMLTTGTPIGAAEYLKQQPGGKIFNEMGYGSYLIWALPGQQVFVDPRVELFPYNLWLDYIRISNGSRYNELLEQYGADRLVVDVKEQEDLIRSLEDDPGWRQEYADRYAQIWRKQ